MYRSAAAVDLGVTGTGKTRSLVGCRTARGTIASERGAVVNDDFTTNNHWKLRVGTYDLFFEPPRIYEVLNFDFFVAIHVSLVAY